MIKRMRMFAGPNGSGKSTVKSVIEPSMLGYYLNPDDLEKAVKRDGYFDVRSLNVPISESEIITFFESHPLTSRANEADFVQNIRFVQEEFIDFTGVGFSSYLSAILTDFLRQKLIESGHSFTFETVMSSADKVQTL